MKGKLALINNRTWKRWKKMIDPSLPFNYQNGQKASLKSLETNMIPSCEQSFHDRGG